MDFMKVFDQTVREIKREVNLKVLKVPEIEQKVLDATDDEPWGPHGTVLGEIAQGTKKYTECQMIMNVLWTRLAEIGKNWRLVYKALTVIEYLVAHGSERAVDEIVEQTYQIASLSSFEYVEPGGKDVGINVRKKSETIVALLNDKDKIQEARNKANANRDKYIGLSSSGLACQPAAASFSSGNFRSSSDRYRGSGNARESYASNASYKGKKDQYGEDKYVKTTKSKREPSRYGSKKQDSPTVRASKTSTTPRKTNIHASSSSQNAPSSKYDDDFDDFDPRGISSAKPSAAAASNQVDLFAQNFVDFSEEPVSLPTDNPTTSVNNSPEVDLFADAAFVSTTPGPDSGTLPAPQANVDLFASQPAPASAASTSIDFFASEPASSVSTAMDLFADENASKPDTTSNIFDPFAAIPMNNFDDLNSLGEPTSHTDPLPIASGEVSHVKNNGTSAVTTPLPKKEAFQVKSGVWADTLSRGLIDLNITAPKKVNLADIGIVGGLTDGSETKDKGACLPSFNMGIGMGLGMDVGKPELSKSTSAPMLDDDFFSSLSSQQNQIGSFKN